MNSTDKVWFVTGASRGFGREIAKEALTRGYRVVATARNLSDLDSLGQDSRLLALPLDVVDPDDIQSAVKAAEARFGAVDVLVNNAGYGYLAAVEEGDDQEVRALFDTNFFGLAAMTRAVLPGQRARKRGVIVNISSVAGFVGLPASGYYAASKFAVEGLSESLLQELSPLGLRVLLVEPGPFRTDWAGISMRQPTEFIDAYETTAGLRRRNVAASSGQQAGCPVRAAKAIIDAVEHPAPPFRLPLGSLAVDTILSSLETVRKDVAPWASVAQNADAPISEELHP